MVIKNFSGQILYLYVTVFCLDHSSLGHHGAAGTENLILCFTECDTVTDNLAVGKNGNNMAASSDGKFPIAIDGALFHTLNDIRTGDTDFV